MLGRFAALLLAVMGHSLSDDTIMLYGSSNDHAHQNKNYLILFEGGRNLGLEQGRSIKINKNKKFPLANIYLGILHALGCEVESFGASRVVFTL